MIIRNTNDVDSNGVLVRGYTINPKLVKTFTETNKVALGELKNDIIKFYQHQLEQPIRLCKFYELDTFNGIKLIDDQSLFYKIHLFLLKNERIHSTPYVNHSMIYKMCIVPIYKVTD